MAIFFLSLFLDFFYTVLCGMRIPGMNLQMSISAKVDDIMTKIQANLDISNSKGTEKSL